jgi:hypothetical protein
MPPRCAFEGGSVIGFKDGQAGVKQLALGHDDDVEAPCDFVTTKNLSNQSLSPVAHNGAPELSRRRDPQPPQRVAVGQDEQRAEPAVHASATLVDLLELSSAPNSFCGAESRHRLKTGFLIRWKPSDACALLRAGA